ncbi:hypothetical protein SK3146_03160 [Paenibacillus konkukensis]|uniref:Transposase n=1 Tax=Paenibacillus konkukensis TaxID=2020716 RepID=A0ABY4RP78_9BACL|nr:hypothetical protein [Paenibacillus konkukensis]UQZ83948.1 hypothetical protein SK3146_03160 [Paenibacillus konkukensis]
MNPIIGLDVSKGENHDQAFFDKNKPFNKTFRFTHTTEGLLTLLDVLKSLEVESGLRPAIIQEATVHYHLSASGIS